MARTFSSSTLERLRCVSLSAALTGLEIYWKADPSFIPTKNSLTERWMVSTDAYVFELLITGQKWFDPRLGIGGAGTIDLVMHIASLDFPKAVKLLIKAGL